VGAWIVASRSQRRAPVWDRAGFLGGRPSERQPFGGLRSVVSPDSLGTGTLKNVARLQNAPAYGYTDQDARGYVKAPNDPDGICFFAYLARQKDYSQVPVRKAAGTVENYFPFEVALAEGARFTLLASSGRCGREGS
jgi:hypothetical protein